MSSPKTVENNGKMRISEKPDKVYIVGNVLMRAIENVIFIQFEPPCQKLWAFMSNLPKQLARYGHVTWLCLQILKFLFFVWFCIKF